MKTDLCKEEKFMVWLNSLMRRLHVSWFKYIYSVKYRTINSELVSIYANSILQSIYFDAPLHYLITITQISFQSYIFFLILSLI